MTVPTQVNQDARIADCWLGTDDTATKDDKGLFGQDKKQLSSVVDRNQRITKD
jgi:hypothetical protein